MFGSHRQCLFSSLPPVAGEAPVAGEPGGPRALGPGAGCKGENKIVLGTHVFNGRRGY
jgi:hypothetical protein